MKTIGRNRKRFAQEVFARAKDVRIYSLDNGFCGESRSPLRVDTGENWLAEAWFFQRHTKLVEVYSGFYRLEFHANYWVEFTTRKEEK